jgi:3-methyladenine DNA glycosylase AlkD
MGGAADIRARPGRGLRELVSAMGTDDAPAAERFVDELRKHQSDEERRKIQRYFKTGQGEYAEGDSFIGVRMGQVFELAKRFIEMDPSEIERLLESDIHEVRAGALSIMDKQARRKRTPDDRRRELYELYRRRIDRINNWDLVDLAAPFVVGGYLADGDRSPLHELARSEDVWERRTAIYATTYLIRRGEVDETFAVAELLLGDEEDLIHKAAGGCLRWAGDKDPGRLRTFLDEHAAEMPPTMLRYATEKLDKAERSRYRAMRSAA